MSDEETTIDELLAELAWSRPRARRVLRRTPASLFGQYAAVVAVVDDHDRHNHSAPAEGEERVLSIVHHTMRLRQEIADKPERSTAAAGSYAQRTGAPDPALLVHADAVLSWLPSIVPRRAGA